MAVSGGMLFNLCFFDILDRKLLRLTSFFGFEGSCDASYSCIRKLAISEQHLRNLSFSGARSTSFDFLSCLSVTVMVSVAMLAELAFQYVKSIATVW